MLVLVEELAKKVKWLSQTAPVVQFAADGSMSAVSDEVSATVSAPSASAEVPDADGDKSFCGAPVRGRKKKPVPPVMADEKPAFVNARKLLSLLKLYAKHKTVELVQDEGRLSIGAVGVYPLTTVSEGESTPYPFQAPEGDSFTLPCADLRRYIDSVSFAASKDGTRPMLCGVRIVRDGDNMMAVATDTYRLMVYGADLVYIGGVTIPQGVPRSKILGMDGDATITDGVNTICVEVGAYKVIADSAGLYPNFEKVIPAIDPLAAHIVLSRESIDAWAAACRHMLAAENTNHHRANIDTVDGAIGLAFETGDDGKRKGQSLTYTIPAAQCPAGSKSAVNAKYMLDMLSRCDADTLNLQITEELGPLRFDWVAKSGIACKYILMPMQSM